MTVTGKTLLENKTIASQVVALRKEGRTVLQIAKTLGHDRRLITAVIKTCVASGMIDKTIDERLKLKGRNKKKKAPMFGISEELGDYEL